MRSKSVSFAWYHLPDSDFYGVVESPDSPPLVLTTLDLSRSLRGFLISPFDPSSCPVVLIKPESFSKRPLTRIDVPLDYESLSQHPSLFYKEKFEIFHSAILSGNFDKLVLAREFAVELETPYLLDELFQRTCSLFPEFMVMLFSTPFTGTWLVCSPEVLLEKQNDTFHTVALAGTLPCTDENGWNQKNRKEQNVVETFIESALLSTGCTGIKKNGPVTSRAGHLQHLKTDFYFHGGETGNVLSTLYPTPAVCGFPKDKAFDFIVKNEGFEREYYSGFAGPLFIENDDFNLYVSLRCAKLLGQKIILYGGGGIMPESDCLTEWNETEQKMNTIARCIKTIK